MGNAECGIKNLRLEAMKEKSECGMRPPAHRGLCLRPGGKAENKSKEQSVRKR